MGTHCRALSFALVFTSLFSARLAMPADAWPADAPLVPEPVRRLMQDRDYSEAVKAIDKAVAAHGAPRDYLAYLKGRALSLANRYDEAAAAFDAMPKDFPRSPWLRRARFAKAVMLSRKGDFRGAELIVRAEAEYLLSADRKQRIAGVYLEFADALFKPPKDAEKPDYARAAEFYQKALEAGPEPAKRIEVEMLLAECRQQLDANAAAVLYQQFIQNHARHALEIEARFRLGECWLATCDLKQARRVWQDLLAAYPDSRSERVAEAQFQLARTWNMPAPKSDDELNLGVAALRTFVERFPAHKLASRAYLEIAESYLDRGRPDDAGAALRQLLADPRYRDRDEVPAARATLGRCYQLQKRYPEAIAAWREYLAKHPAHKEWSSVQREIIDTEYLMAVEKLEAKQFDAANKLFAQFMVKYPLDGRVPGILLSMNGKAIAAGRWHEAIAAWRQIVSKYPDSPEASLAQFSIAEALEHNLGKPEEAIDEYRKTTWGPSAGRAAQAIAQLTAKRMTVATERVFRSDETPKLTLVTRNVDAVTVRAYHVDLETYFRKMHAATGIEGLDIALIDPDKTFEFKVPNYAKHQQLESRIEVPLPGGARTGVMAVTVSSKTLEATTLVIQSDLDAIVKCVRDEVFVFTENMRTGKPWPGARLLISDGRQVFAEGTTGKDGVFQRTYKEVKEAGDVRVFAVADDHVAANVVGLQGVGVVQGLTDKGYIYTDRPAYRAGQRVQIRGCLRRAAGDVYTIEKGKKYALEVFDPRNRLLWREMVTLGEFGSFHAQIALPAATPEGQYRVLVHDDDGRNFTGGFVVQEYHLEPVRLTIDTPRRVYYRGEQIEGTIRAAYYYGAPLAGRDVRYRLADDRVYTATTDAKGEVRFKLPTEEFSETQPLALWVWLPERNLETAVNFMLAAQGFSVAVSTVRPVYVAGETFEAAVVAKDAEGKPTGQKLALKVFELSTVQGKVAQRLVEENSLRTAADGRARKTLKLGKGGNYVVRAEGIDRFNNPISGQCTVQISGDEDEVRLRILADAHSYKVGDRPSVKIHWRERPSLALVTFQGARVLGYRLVKLKTGVNELPVSMTPELAPNFDLAISVMTDVRDTKRPATATAGALAGEIRQRPAARFHEASSPFNVARELRVACVARRKGPGSGPLRPGEVVQVSVTTTDPQGNPVSAELSLAMVEQALLDRFPDRLPPIQDYFQAQRRESAVRTVSSITFAYDPTTQPINPRLLAEEDRAAVAAEEDLSRRLAIGRSPVHHHGRSEDIGGSRAQPSGTPARPQRTPGERSQGGVGGAEDPFATGAEEGDNEVHEEIDEGRAARQRVARGPGGMAGFAPMGPVGRPGVRQSSPPPPAAMETACWIPAIETDKNGRGAATCTLPGQSTQWRLLLKGITVDTLAGEAADSLVVKKDLFGELKLPSSFTDGDQADVIASVHNDALAKGPIQVTLDTTVAGRHVAETKTVEAAGKHIREVAFHVSLGGKDQAPGGGVRSNSSELSGAQSAVEFVLTVTAAKWQDVAYRTVPLLPYGAPVYATAAGSAAADTTVWVEPPHGVTLQKPTLSILIGPTVERSLLDALLAPPPPCQVEVGRIASDLESATSDLIAALGLQKLFGGRDAAPQAQELDARIHAAIGLLLARQDEDGGWSWTGCGRHSERFASSRALWALGLARKAGYHVPDGQFQKAVGWVQEQLVATADDDYESKAILLNTLATLEKADFALANRLYRERQRLSAAALANLSLALAEMDRAPMAAELLDLLATRSDGAASRRAAEGRSPPASQSPAEIRALWALAAETATPRSPQAKQLVDWLLAHRHGHRWSPDKATGPAVLALCRWFAVNRFQGEHYSLKVSVNGAPVKTLAVDPRAGTLSIEVPPATLQKEGKQRIHFEIAGRGRYAYQCILGGFVPAQRLESTTRDWQVTRTYEPAPLEVDGREVPRGFDVLQGTFAKFKNPLTQLPVGKRGLVELNIRRMNLRPDVPEERLEYLVVTEPVPAGAAVIDHSVGGGFERFELSPGAITFYIGSRRKVEPIRYEVYGYLPGDYRAAPTLVRDAYRPELFAVSTPKALGVLPAGGKSADPYRLTPAELFALGKHDFARGALREAGERLTELLKNWNLGADTYRETVQMLLDVHLELGPPAEIVHYIEIVKEKWPEVEVPFAKIMKVSAAYHAIGEFERSYLVLRATVESSFVRDTAMAGFLETEGQFARSVDVLGQLLREYPPEGYTAEAAYSLAQHVLAKAPQAAADPELRREKINRVDLVQRAWSMLESFMTDYPDDPAADQAAFAAATALLDLKAYPEAAAACDRYAVRYPKSELLDSFWYVIGYCRFAGGQHEAALEMCRKVAEATRIDPDSGREEPSRNKWQAIYILGQVYHSLGKAADAVREYRRVADKFPDAQQAIEYFLRKAIELPEVVTVKPAGPVEVELAFRNVAACDLKVYRIDLMKFGLLNQNLSRITQINLAGIRPRHEATVALGDGKDYRDRTRKLTLPIKEEGAYLVVCRGDNLHASGLVLVTPLAIDVQADAVAGRVRTTVKDRDKYQPGVHVKVIGNGNADFVSGQTDLRGVFVADGIQGGATVIAQAGPSRYAFFRAKGFAPAPREVTSEPYAYPLDTPPNEFLPTPREVTPRSLSAEVPAARRVYADAGRRSAEEQKIDEALDSPTAFDFNERPLSEVIEYLKDRHGIAVQLDEKSLADAGVTRDTPVSKSVKGISLRSALRLLLRDLTLTYLIKDDVLMITTPEKADEELITRVYPVIDLVLPLDATEGMDPDFDSMIDLITSTVRPTSWEEVGGPGSIRPLDTKMSIVISQTQEVHEEINDLLGQLRSVSLDQRTKEAILKTWQARQHGNRGAAGGNVGGMGGMGGGMWGGGNAPNGPAKRAKSAPGAPEKADLLEGVEETNRGLQGKQSEKLKKTYQRGGGMGGMGGVGGGMW